MKPHLSLPLLASPFLPSFLPSFLPRGKISRSHVYDHSRLDLEEVLLKSIVTWAEKREGFHICFLPPTENGLPFFACVFRSIFAKGFLLLPLFWGSTIRSFRPLLSCQGALLCSQRTQYSCDRERQALSEEEVSWRHITRILFPNNKQKRADTWPNFFGPVSTTFGTRTHNFLGHPDARL